MKMRVVMLAAAMLTAGSSGGPRAQGINIIAETLADDCRHKWPDKQWINCAAYLEGVLDTLQVGMVIRRTADGKVTVVQTADGLGPLCVVAHMAFVKFIDRHPEKREASPRVVAAEALIATDENPPRGKLSPFWGVCGRNAR